MADEALEILEIQIPLWSDKWNTEALKTHEKRIGPLAFNRGLRNIAISNSDRTFPSFEKCISNKKVSEVTSDSMVYFSGVDMSTKKRPGTCIFTLARDAKNKLYIPVDIRYGKYTGPRMLQEIKNVYKLFKPKSFLVENNALQDMVIDFLKEDIKKNKDKTKPFIKGHFTGSNKLNPEHGLESLEIDFFNDSWVIPFGDKVHKLSCKCGFCKFKDEAIGHPLYHSDDIVMAAWLARENARKSVLGKIRLL